MNKKLVGGIVGAVIGIAALGLGIRKAYVAAEVKGCQKAIMKLLEQKYGEAPDDVKAKVLAQLDKECRQIL